MNTTRGATHWAEFYKFITYYKVGEVIEVWEFGKFEYYDELTNLHEHDLKPLN